MPVQRQIGEVAAQCHSTAEPQSHSTAFAIRELVSSRHPCADVHIASPHHTSAPSPAAVQTGFCVLMHTTSICQIRTCAWYFYVAGAEGRCGLHTRSRLVGSKLIRSLLSKAQLRGCGNAGWPLAWLCWAGWVCRLAESSVAAALSSSLCHQDTVAARRALYSCT